MHLRIHPCCNGQFQSYGTYSTNTRLCEPRKRCQNFRKLTGFKEQGVKGKLLMPTGSQYTSLEWMISVYIDGCSRWRLCRLSESLAKEPVTNFGSRYYSVYGNSKQYPCSIEKHRTKLLCSDLCGTLATGNEPCGSTMTSLKPMVAKEVEGLSTQTNYIRVEA